MPVVYHRDESETQTPEVAKLQQRSQQIWGHRPRGSDFPKVSAFAGSLQKRGIEFATEVVPDPGHRPHIPTWSRPTPGVIEIDDDTVAIPAEIRKNTQAEEVPGR